MGKRGSPFATSSSFLYGNSCVIIDVRLERNVVLDQAKGKGELSFDRRGGASISAAVCLCGAKKDGVRCNNYIHNSLSSSPLYKIGLDIRIIGIKVSPCLLPRAGSRGAASLFGSFLCHIYCVLFIILYLIHLLFNSSLARHII